MHGNNKGYTIKDLIDYSKNYNLPPSIAILIKASDINYKKATTLLQHFHDNTIEDIENLKSATIKLIRIKDLFNNFTEENSGYQSRREILSYFEVQCGNVNDRELIKFLATKYAPDNNPLFVEERWIIENIKNSYKSNDIVTEVFELDYTTADIRYATLCKYYKKQKDHVVELQIIRKVCQYCNYNLTEAAAFAQHFNKNFNLQTLNININRNKGIAVRKWLNNKKTDEIIIKEIKSKYWNTIQLELCKSIKQTKENFDDAIKALDKGMSVKAKEFIQVQNVTKGSELDYTTTDIRKATLYTYNQQKIDHVVELQIINKVCHDCNYDLTKAAEFAKHFNEEFNLPIGDYRHNQVKNEAVTKWLGDGTTNEIIEQIKSAYWDDIRPKPCKFIGNALKDFEDVIAKLDKLMEKENNLSRRFGQMSL